MKDWLMNFVYDETPTLWREEQIKRLKFSEYVDEYDKVYEALYESDNLEDMIDMYWMGDKLIEKTEQYFKTEEGKQFIKDWYEYTWDTITSDREYKAIAIALYLHNYND